MGEELKVTISADIEQLKKGCQEASKEISGFGKEADKQKSAVKKAFETMGNIAKTSAKAMATAVGAVSAGLVAVGKAFADGITDVATYGDNIDKMSQKMGLSAEGYQEWDFVMQHCGTSIDSMKASMKTLATATETNIGAFERLGISQEQVASMSQEDLFNATIAGLQNVTDETERTYLAGQLLGKGATELGPLLNMTAEETEAMKQQLHDLGGVMSNEAVKNSAMFQDSLQNLQTAISGAKNTVFSEFLPSITSVMDGLTMIFSGDSEGGLAKINEGVGQFTEQLTQALPQVLTAGGQIVTTILTAITQNLPQIIQAGMQVVTLLVQGIVDNLPALIDSLIILEQEILNALPGVVQTICDALPTLLPQIIDGACALLVQLCETFPEIISVIIEALPEVIMSIVESLMENLPLLIEGVISLVLGIVENVGLIIETLIPMIPTIITEVVNGLLQCLPQLLAGVVQIVISLFTQLLPSVITCVIEFVKNLFVSIRETTQQAFATIGELFSKVGGWIYDNVIVPVVDFFKGLWEDVSGFFSGLWEDICGIFKTVANWFNQNVIQPIVGFFSGLWQSVSGFFSGLWDDICGVWNAVAGWFNDKVIQPIVGFFQGLGEDIKGVWNGIINAIKGAINGIIGGINGMIRGVCSGVNFVIRCLNKIHFDIPDWVPVIGGKSFGFSISEINPPQIPLLEQGGILAKGQVGLLEGNGTEAVVPLENNLGWLDKMADLLASKTGNTQPMILQVDGKTFARIVCDEVNTLTRTTGSIPLVIA